MILEAILGVRDASRARGVRFAPMGASLSEGLAEQRVLLRPFASSRTGALLSQEGRGVLNFTDDVYLFAQTALTDETPASDGLVLENVCEWWEIEVAEGFGGDLKTPGPDRRSLVCLIRERRAARPFAPFNRARHAVLEAAILATRARLNDADALRAELRALREIVVKTGEEREIAAFDLIRSYL